MVNINHFQNPVELLEVPEVQKLFQLRTRDAELFRSSASEYLRAMAGEYWKFRMAVEFHDAGHFQYLYWKARYSLWSAALESIFTTRHSEHSGSKVAKERIKWLLGGQMRLYPQGDIPPCFPSAQTNLTIADVLDDLYSLRNYLAHGDKIPDSYFRRILRQGINGDLNVPAVCTEALSFIVRNSLVGIIQRGLLEHFKNANTAEAYFSGNGLTRSAIAARRGAPGSGTP